MIPAEEKPALTLPSILIVEDEQLIRWSLKQRLEQAGYTVIVAENGSQAVDLFHDGCELVLLDLKLPDADGLELLRHFKEERPGCKVILMTAYGSPEVETEAERQGVFEVIDKPFNLEDLTHLVQQALATGHA